MFAWGGVYWKMKRFWKSFENRLAHSENVKRVGKPPLVESRLQQIWSGKSSTQASDKRKFWEFRNQDFRVHTRSQLKTDSARERRVHAIYLTQNNSEKWKKWIRLRGARETQWMIESMSIATRSDSHKEEKTIMWLLSVRKRCVNSPHCLAWTCRP